MVVFCCNIYSSRTGSGNWINVHDGITYWEKKDTSAMPVALMFGVAEILAHRPLYYEEINVPAVTGYNKAARYKECFYVKKIDGEFEVPFFDFLYKREIGLTVYYGINNEFNAGGLPQIESNDTIIIQSYTLKLKLNDL